MQTNRRLGDLELLRPIGRGGAGTIWEARQLSLDRIVAVKLLNGLDAHSTERRARFAREAKLLGRVAHPGIVPVLGHGELDGVAFMVMERVVGCDLGAALTALRAHARAGERIDGRLLERVVQAHAPEERAGAEAQPRAAHAPVADESWPRCAARIVRDVALALDHAHRCGVLHRDLKPSNVLLAANGRVLLADFGLAHRLEEGASASDSASGSLPYLAPELLGQGAHAQDDALAEVYALGVLLYETVALRRPFEARDPRALVHQILRGNAPRLRSHVVDAGERGGCKAFVEDLEWIAAKAMARDSRERYATAIDVARDLAAALEGRAVSARPRRAWAAVRGIVQRHRRAATLVATLGLAAWIGPSMVELQRIASAERVQAANELAGEHLKLAVRTIDAMLVETGRDELTGHPMMNGVREYLLGGAVDFFESTEGDPSIREFGVRPDWTRAYVGGLLALGGLERDRGAVDAASKRLERALSLNDTWVDGRTEHERAARAAALRVGRAAVHRRAGSLAEATEDAERALQLIEHLDDATLCKNGGYGVRFSIESCLASLCQLQGKAAEGVLHARRSVEAARADRVAVGDGWRQSAQGRIASALNTLGALYFDLGDFPAAKEACTEAVAAFQLAAKNPMNGKTLALAYDNLGLIANSEGRAEDRDRYFLFAIGIQERLVQAFPNSLDDLYRYGNTASLLAGVVIPSPENRPHGVRLVRQAESAARRLCRESPKSSSYHALLARALELDARVLQLEEAWEPAQAKLDEAAQHLDVALELAPGRGTLQSRAKSNWSFRAQNLTFRLLAYERAVPVLADGVERFAAHGTSMRDAAAMYVHCAVQSMADASLAEDRRSELRDELFDEAIHALELAAEAGYDNVRDLEEAYIFGPIRDLPEFVRLRERMALAERR